MRKILAILALLGPLGAAAAPMVTVPGGGGTTTTVYSSTANPIPATAVHYIASSAQSAGTGDGSTFVILNADTKITDTDNAVTTGASWKFTVPSGKAGRYFISSEVSIGSLLSPTQEVLALFKNGTKYRALNMENSSIANAAGIISGSIAVDLVAGDYIDIRFLHSAGTGKVLADIGTSNWVTITRVPDVPSYTPGSTGSTPRADYGCSTAQVLATGGIVNFDTKTVDTDNAVTTGAGWRFTVPAGKGGVYSITGSLLTSGTFASFQIYKNGVASRYASSTTSTTVGSITTTLDLAAGDYIDVRATGGNTLAAGVNWNWISIYRLPDTVVALAGSAGATPNAGYQITSGGGGTIATTATAINYNTKLWDSDTAVTTGTAWKFTVPSGKGGLYQVCASVSYSTTVSAAVYTLNVYKNGVLYAPLDSKSAGGTTGAVLDGCATVSLAATDYVQIMGTSSSGNPTFSTTALSQVSIYRYPDSLSDDTGWIAVSGFANGWSSFASFPAYYRRKNGVVYFKGQLVGGTNATTAFTMPAGFRVGNGPNKVMNVYTDGNVVTNLTFLGDGTGNVTGYRPSGTYITLENLSYIAEQ